MIFFYKNQQSDRHQRGLYINISRGHIFLYQYATRLREMSHLLNIFNYEFFTPLCGNLKMLHFDANPIIIGYRVMSYEQFIEAQKQYKTGDISETIFATSDSFPLFMSHISAESTGVRSIIICIIRVTIGIVRRQWRHVRV